MPLIKYGCDSHVALGFQVFLDKNTRIPTFRDVAVRTSRFMICGHKDIRPYVIDG